MQISAAGNKPRFRPGGHHAFGFTLLELLVVVSIIAMSTAGVSLALRDSSETRLEREAGRLAALLEAARARSLTSGVAVVWRAVPGGFRFEGLPEGSLPERWLNADTWVSPPAVLELGPEPVIARQSLRLGSRGKLDNDFQPGSQWQVATDGLRPFQVQSVGAGGSVVAP